jgi:hypothetical protein
VSGIVWLASYPKSGNTWLRILLANYLRDAGEPADINKIFVGPAASARHRWQLGGADVADPLREVLADELGEHRGEGADVEQVIQRLRHENADLRRLVKVYAESIRQLTLDHLELPSAEQGRPGGGRCRPRKTTGLVISPCSVAMRSPRATKTVPVTASMNWRIFRRFRMSPARATTSE